MNLSSRWRTYVGPVRAYLVGETSRNLGVVLAGHLWRLALGLLSSALLARGLGPEGLRVFAVLSALMMVALPLADMGLSQSGVRFIARDLAQEPEKALRTARSFAGLKVLGGVVVGMLVLLLAPLLLPLLHLPEKNGLLLLGLVGLGVLLLSYSGIVATILQAIRRFNVLVLTQSLNVLVTVSVLGVLFFGGRLTVVHAFMAGLGGTLTAFLLGWRLLPRPWRRSIRVAVRPPGAGTRRLVHFGSWIWLSTLFATLFFQLDLLLLNRWATPYEAGIYALAFNLSLKALVLHQALFMVLLPTFSRVSDLPLILAHARRSLIPCVALIGLLALSFPVIDPLVTLIYGTPYAPSVPLLYLLLCVVILDLFTLPLSLMTFSMDTPRLLAFAMGLRVGVLLVTGLLLIPPFMGRGAALAKLLAMLAGSLYLGGSLAHRYRTVRRRAVPSEASRETMP